MLHVLLLCSDIHYKWYQNMDSSCLLDIEMHGNMRSCTTLVPCQFLLKVLDYRHTFQRAAAMQVMLMLYITGLNTLHVNGFQRFKRFSPIAIVIRIEYSLYEYYETNWNCI